MDVHIYSCLKPDAELAGMCLLARPRIFYKINNFETTGLKPLNLFGISILDLFIWYEIKSSLQSSSTDILRNLIGRTFELLFITRRAENNSLDPDVSFPCILCCHLSYIHNISRPYLHCIFRGAFKIYIS